MSDKITAEIIKIHPRKVGRNGVIFERVEFKITGSGDWATTDLCPSFRNYSRWKDLLQVGNLIGNLELKYNNKINADSYPELL